MTIVVAMKFPDRICVLSDTMITDRESTGPNIVPGRLKSIVINHWLTISYAGLSIPAIDAARKIYRKENITTELAMQHLVKASESYSGELDFILCSHEHGSRLVKIVNGHVFEGGNIYWIGITIAAKEFSKEFSKVKIPNANGKSLPDYISPEEMVFKNAFHEFMRANRCEGVGGTIIDCLCSPSGHCYNTHAGAFSWDTIVLGKDDLVQREITNKTGLYHYEYNVCSTSARGHAIVGLYLGQAKTGFIYDPIHDDDAMKVKNCSMLEFSYLVEDAGKVLANKNA